MSFRPSQTHSYELKGRGSEREKVIQKEKSQAKANKPIIVMIERGEGEDSTREVLLGARGSKEITPTSSIVPFPFGR